MLIVTDTCFVCGVCSIFSVAASECEKVWRMAAEVFREKMNNEEHTLQNVGRFEKISVRNETVVLAKEHLAL